MRFDQHSSCAELVQQTVSVCIAAAQSCSGNQQKEMLLIGQYGRVFPACIGSILRRLHLRSQSTSSISLLDHQHKSMSMNDIGTAVLQRRQANGPGVVEAGRGTYPRRQQGWGGEPLANTEAPGSTMVSLTAHQH